MSIGKKPISNNNKIDLFVTFYTASARDFGGSLLKATREHITDKPLEIEMVLLTQL